MTLSVDIGRSYLAWAYVQEFEITYGVDSFAENRSVDVCRWIKYFFENFDVKRVLIEKQVPVNTRCVLIMNLLVGVAVGLGVDCVEVVDARDKFRQLGVEYTTKNHAHKSLSVDMALQWLEESGVEDLSGKRMCEYEKQDDIADAINQLRGWVTEFG
jgi:hypothetical protein